jgi:predicted ATPase/class 3 adenylate cyclase
MSRPVVRPTGTVTFLFTDIEESSRQWESDASATEALVASHDKLVRMVVEGHDGYVFTTMGDGFAVAFQRASRALAAAVELQEALAGEEWASSGLRVRIGAHTGEAIERDGDYFGPTVNRAARIMALAHGRQILLSAVTAGLVPEFETVELGGYQLRGLARPERVHQVVAAGLPREFPPLHGDSGTAHNLPAELTSFVGRQAEIEDLVERVHEARLITLVGPGGAGKTRLATETAQRLLDEFPNGVWLAELAALRDPAQVAATVAKAIGRHDPLAKGGGPGLVRDRLAAAIGAHRVLLILDNCEHVLEAATELVAGLLAACPLLVVIATSRQSLGVGGERLVEIESLDLPVSDDAAAVAASAAGALFVDRAQAVRSRFQLDSPTAMAVAEVCRRLDGLPLAIELAAARVRLLSVAQIRDRLEETLAVPSGGHRGVDRHQTMWAALAWSYDLLNEAEQRLFRRLAVFRTSFVLDAAAAIAPEVSGDILSVLGGLVDKSLVAAVDGPAGGERRFRLLEPARQFAAELLQASGEQDDAASRQRQHLLSRLRTYHRDQRTGGVPDPESPAYAELVAEVDNVRAAVEHSMRRSEPEAAVTLIMAYWPWWPDLGLVDEYVDRMTAALRTADPARMSLGVLSWGLCLASNNALFLGRLAEAGALVDRLADLRDQHPDRHSVRADWAYAMAFLTWFQAGGDRSQGNRLMREAQQAYEELGLFRKAISAAVCIPVAAIPWDAADDPEVARAITDATRLSQKAESLSEPAYGRVLDWVIQVMGGDRHSYPSSLDAFAELEAVDGGWYVFWCGWAVGVAAELVGDRPVAAAHALRLVRFCRRSGIRLMLAWSIRGIARLSASMGYPRESLRLWGSAEHIEAVTGQPYMPLMERLDRPLRQQCADAVGPDGARLLAEGASWSAAAATQAAEEALLRLQAEKDV